MINFILSLFTQPNRVAWFNDFPQLNTRYLAVSNAWGEPRSALK